MEGAIKATREREKERRSEDRLRGGRKLIKREREGKRNTELPGVARPVRPVYEAVNRSGSMCALRTPPPIIDKSVCVNEST